MLGTPEDGVEQGSILLGEVQTLDGEGEDEVADGRLHAAVEADEEEEAREEGDLKEEVGPLHQGVILRVHSRDRVLP